MLRGVVIAVPALLAGCLEIPPAATSVDAAAHDAAALPDAAACLDLDEDLWFAGSVGGCLDGRALDCDDGDAARHPGAREVAGEDMGCRGAVWDGVGAMPGIVAGVAGGDLEVTVGALRLELDDSVGHALASVQLGDSGELLYRGGVEERYAGVEAWQRFFSHRPGDGDARTVLVESPAVLRVQVAWADGASLTGTTTWTIHGGSGRVYRREVLDLETVQTISNVTAYQALDGAALGWIDWQSNPGAAEQVAFGAPDFSANALGETSWMCGFRAGALGFEVGMLSRPDASSTSVRSTRLTTQRDVDDVDVIAMQYDWSVSAQPSASASYAGNFQMIVMPTVGAPCGQVEAADQAWEAPPQVSVVARSGTVLAAVTEEDGDGDGYAEAGGYYTLDAGASPLQIALAPAGSVAGPVLFRISGLPAGEPYVESVEGEEVTRMLHGRDYLMSAEVPGGGDRWLLSLIAPGRGLWVTSPPPL